MAKTTKTDIESRFLRFLDVFPEELPGIPPIRFVEFNIVLIPELSQSPKSLSHGNDELKTEGSTMASAKVEAIHQMAKTMYGRSLYGNEEEIRALKSFSSALFPRHYSYSPHCSRQLRGMTENSGNYSGLLSADRSFTLMTMAFYGRVRRRCTIDLSISFVEWYEARCGYVCVKVFTSVSWDYPVSNLADNVSQEIGGTRYSIIGIGSGLVIYVSRLVLGKFSGKLGEPGSSLVHFSSEIDGQSDGRRRREKLRSQTRQKGSAGQTSQCVRVHPGEHVFLKYHSTRGVRRFWYQGASLVSLIGRLEILDRGWSTSIILFTLSSYPFSIRSVRFYLYGRACVYSRRQDRVMWEQSRSTFVKITLEDHPCGNLTWEIEESLGLLISFSAMNMDISQKDKKPSKKRQNRTRDGKVCEDEAQSKSSQLREEKAKKNIT
ncbi:hypothetical protein Tco_1515353 [Tanacetum coccineum]